jgi:hypothetical protein
VTGYELDGRGSISFRGRGLTYLLKAGIIYRAIQKEGKNFTCS